MYEASYHIFDGFDGVSYTLKIIMNTAGRLRKVKKKIFLFVCLIVRIRKSADTAVTDKVYLHSLSTSVPRRHENNDDVWIIYR